jgi:SAM-dependent methyltransferase
MRTLVGPTDLAAFDNPNGELVYSYLSAATYESVLDFGCGCGRVARQLMLQRHRPQRYLGLDLHRGMVEWCNNNLAPAVPGFEFRHHDVFSYHFNPGPEKPHVLPFPVADRSFTLVNAISVFTHLTDVQANHYLQEISRVLAEYGRFHASWFLFERSEFPMLHECQNALYASYVDPNAVVIFERDWVRVRAREAGLVIVGAIPPQVRGFHWLLVMAHAGAGLSEVELPADTAPAGCVDRPMMPPNPSRIGLGKLGV